MASAFVQDAALSNGGTGAPELSFPSMTLTSGNTLVVCMLSNHSGNTYGISDDKGNTYQADLYNFDDTDGNHLSVWYVKSIGTSGATVITITSNNFTQIRAHALEFSGFDTTNTLNFNTTVKDQASASSLTTNSGTATVAAMMLVCFVIQDNFTATGFTAGTIGSGTGTIPTNGTDEGCAVAYHHESANTGPYTGTISWTNASRAAGVLLGLADAGAPAVALMGQADT